MYTCRDYLDIKNICIYTKAAILSSVSSDDIILRSFAAFCSSPYLCSNNNIPEITVLIALGILSVLGKNVKVNHFCQNWCYIYALMNHKYRFVTV